MKQTSEKKEQLIQREQAEKIYTILEKKTCTHGEQKHISYAKQKITTHPNPNPPFHFTDDLPLICSPQRM